MREIKILHVSDIHFKKKEKAGFRTFREDVSLKMIQSIGRHVEKQGIPEFVAITGDISYNGQDYDEATAFFEELKKIIPKAIFLPVPGNHDVDREEIFKHVSLNNIVKSQETNSFLEEEKNIQTFISPKFEKFRNFSDKLNSRLYKNENDYYWVHDYKKDAISFMGLNSCWACQGNEDRNNITLGYPQVMGALNRSDSSLFRE